MKRRVYTIHDGSLWLRLAQIIKTEEPIEIEILRRWCKDVPLTDLLFTGLKNPLAI